MKKMITSAKKEYRKTFLALFFASTLAPALNAQINLSATAGNTGPTSYTSINAAFAAINQGTHQGSITILVIGNTTEPATPTPLLKSNLPSAYTGVTITPFGGNFTISSAASPVANRGIIELAGADNVTIDGDDPLTMGTQNLTILSNTATTAGIACIRLSSNSTIGIDGADNNTVKNCIIIGSRDDVNSTIPNYGIQFSNGVAASATNTGAYSSLNTVIDSNSITRCYYGIHAIGNSPTYLNTGTRITRNIIGSANPADYVAFVGIDISYSSVNGGATSALIGQNDIRTGFANPPDHLSSILVAAANAGLLITRNNIHESSSLGPNVYQSMYGIRLNSTVSNNSITITNNFIRDIAGYNLGFALGGGFGIYSNQAVSSGLIINNNTIVQGSSSSASICVGVCIYLNEYNTPISQILNNILVNNVPNPNAICLYLRSNVIANSRIDHNDYYINPFFNPIGRVAHDGNTSYISLTNWQAAWAKDANSINVLPSFVSATDLHLQNSIQPTPLESGGAIVGITGVGIDIDGQARPGPNGSVNGGGTRPDIGADEFDGGWINRCFVPASPLTVSSITHSTAVINWTPTGSEQSWIINYTAPTTSLLVGTNSYTMTNLTPSTNYTVKVRAYCGVGDTSNWTTIKQFQTMCLYPDLLSVSVNTVCVSGSPTLSAVSSGTSTIKWYTSATGGVIASTGPTFVTPNLITTANYYAAPISGVGTPTACEGLRTLVTATVSQKPTLSASSITGTICEGSSTYLFSLGSGSSYTWNPGGMNTQNINVMPITTTVYTVSSENAPNCANTATVALTVKPNPTVNVASANMTICAGETATLLATGNPTAYVWSNGAGNNATAYVMPTVNTNYSVTGYGANGCFGTSIVSVQVNPLPPLFVSSSKNVICLNESINLYAISPATSYVWSNGGNTSMIAVSPSITTTYSVSASNGLCSSKGSVVVTVEACTGLNELNKTDGIILYPNPANNVLNIVCSHNFISETSMQVFDALGKLIIEQTLHQGSTEIKVTQLEKGIYFYRINDGTGTIKAGKIVKQ